jgi:hypothetical protein
VTRLSDIQLDWQSAAFHALFVVETDREPWVHGRDLTAAIREVTGCTAQAASGALRSLISVGLAERAETAEGIFFRRTAAAERAYEISQFDLSSVAA